MKRINKKGFTLVELLAVIVILGVLLLIAVPAVSNIIESSKKKSFESAATLALENVESVLSVENTIGTVTRDCYIKLGDIKLERGSFGTNSKGYVYVPTTGNVAISYTDGTFEIKQKTLKNNVTAAKNSSSTIIDITTNCTWWS